jgi:hypothetical protein
VYYYGEQTTTVFFYLHTSIEEWSTRWSSKTLEARTVANCVCVFEIHAIQFNSIEQTITLEMTLCFCWALIEGWKGC